MSEKRLAKPRLQALLEERGINSVELAFATRVELTTIHRFDRSVRFNIDDLVKISRALNMPIEELFDIKTEEEASIVEKN